MIALPPRIHDSVRLISEGRLVIGRKGAARDVLACGEDEATALEGDVLHGRKPGVPVVRCWGAIDVDALGVHVHTQHRHVVLPADDGADASQGRLEDRHGRAIREAPNEPLACGRHQLPVLADQAAGAVEEQGRAIKCPAVTLDAANHYEDVGLRRGFGDDADFFPVQIDRGVIVLMKGFASFGLAHANRAAEGSPLRIAAKKGFREHDEASTFSCRTPDDFGGLVRSGNGIVRDGSDLCDRCFPRLGHGLFPRQTRTRCIQAVSTKMTSRSLPPACQRQTPR